MRKKNAAGNGSIRQRKDGVWEGRFTYVDELGQPRRGSVYASTQRECRRKMTTAQQQVDEESYHVTKRKLKVKEWLNEWLDTYCVDLTPATIKTYRHRINTHLIPNIGEANLNSLTNPQVQRLINRLYNGNLSQKQKPLSAKTVKCVHGVLHKALSQAVICGLITVNPADHIKLPKAQRPDLKPLMDEDINRFLAAIKGERYELIYYVDLFSGLRQSEILGLEWQDIDFENGVIYVRRQLHKNLNGPGYVLVDRTKSHKNRIAYISSSVVSALLEQKRRQEEWKVIAGALWNNPDDLVFTNELGGHLVHGTVRRHFKWIMRDLGLDETRFHDMRHSYAINALQYGDNPNEVSAQLGHYSSAFTMDVYGGVSKTAGKAAQDRMEDFIQSISKPLD